MKFLGNSIVGRMFAHFQLKLSTKGLYYKTKVKNHDYYIFITDDISKIASLLGIDHKEFKSIKDPDDFYEYIFNNPHMKLPLFERYIDGRGGRMLEEFAYFLKTKEYTDSYTRISKEEIIEYFQDEKLGEKIKMSQDIDSGVYSFSKKINKVVDILKSDDKYSVQNLSEDLPNFFNKFEHKSDLNYYVYKIEADTIASEIF